VVGRSPDTAKIKDKMVSASSRDALRRSFVGIALEVQGTDYSEVAHETGELKIRFSPLFCRTSYLFLLSSHSTKSWTKHCVAVDLYVTQQPPTPPKLPLNFQPVPSNSTPNVLVLVIACRRENKVYTEPLLLENKF
jgi:Cofilin/tropomyosin-type actin-binding protein